MINEFKMLRNSFDNNNDNDNDDDDDDLTMDSSTWQVLKWQAVLYFSAVKE